MGVPPDPTRRRTTHSVRLPIELPPATTTEDQRHLRRLTVLLTAVLAGVGIVALAGHGLVSRLLALQQERVVASGLAASQVQRVLEISLVATSIGHREGDVDVHKKRLRHAADELVRVHAALAEIPLDALSRETRDAVEQIHSGAEGALREFVAAARSVAERGDNGIRSDDPDVRRVQRAAAGELVESLNQAAAIYREAASVGTATVLGNAVTGTLVIVLAAVGFLVILPSARRVAREMVALRAAEHRFRGLLESAPDAVIIVNRDGVIEIANSQAERLFGYSRPELLGRPVEILVPERFRERHVFQRKEFVESSGARPMRVGLDIHARRKDGTEFPCEISLSPLQTEQGILVTSSIRDVSLWRQSEARLRALNETLEQRVRDGIAIAEMRAEELARSNDELQRFAYVASHDLREPLRKIDAFGERLAKTAGPSLSEQALDYVARMQQAVRRMQTLIDDLLAYSRVSTAIRPFEAVDLKSIVRDVVADLEVNIETSGAAVEVDDLPSIDADPLLMRQLFQNLISNALKFRRRGVPPRIRVRAAPTEGTSASMVTMVVEDNGIGFDPKHRERIFELFQRLHGRSEYEGTGLGLAICRRIVQRHGGTITADGRPDEGATIRITLPLRSRLHTMEPTI